MEKVLTNEVVEEIITMRLKSTKEFQKCSFIMPDGYFLKMEEHYEAYKFLVVEELVPCIPDAEELLNELGWVRFSWIGYITLPDKELTVEQYNSLELALIEIARYRYEISIQIHSQPKFYKNYQLNDIPLILDRIKKFYAGFSLI